MFNAKVVEAVYHWGTGRDAHNEKKFTYVMAFGSLSEGTKGASLAQLQLYCDPCGQRRKRQHLSHECMVSILLLATPIFASLHHNVGRLKSCITSRSTWSLTRNLCCELALCPP